MEFINVSKKFNDLKVLNNFNIRFEKDKITCLFGPSGVGKTTIANIAANLTEIDNGEVKVTENAVYSFVFQEPRLLEWYSVYDNIDFVLKNVYNSDKRVNIIKDYIDMVELKDFESYKPKELSGGMAQRVSLARAFAYPSNVLILDEPFKGLDMKLKREMISLFKKLWNESKRTVLFITHDVDEAVTLSDFIYILNEKPAKIIDYINILEYNDVSEVKYRLDI
ncbi:ABC transporter ATP-binding protein [Sedimentibacter hydroxybenzoicus DSM 7310]|uniref:ABC transporter ATP-binding protein n=1 Tax=Sedimentibacter hydroxybenzoicus DSM 7310 TaxID=1123245 RepID=A0A974BML2_SEDHY|nr:ABC transporter ATP-binding protein [Sedimentibacter hydroxybenzoicus DSM 7310]